jgi:lipopolysaccharide export LptBFGC system permease protein LptF
MRALLVAILILIALGFYQDWLHPATNQMNADTGKERSQSLGGVEEQPGAKQSGNETALGWVKKVEATDHSFSMTTLDNEKLTVYAGHSTTLKLNGREITLADLEVGDQVRVAYDIKDGRIAATSITVDRR